MRPVGTGSRLALQARAETQPKASWMEALVRLPRQVTRWKPTLSATRYIAPLSLAVLHVARFPTPRIAAVTKATTALA
jgi:hypothetical protein